MATPVHNDLLLPLGTILVLVDGGSETTGTIFRRSAMGGGHFKASTDPIIESDHILFVVDMATEVEVDGVEYMAMGSDAVVGIIPE